MGVLKYLWEKVITLQRTIFIIHFPNKFKNKFLQPAMGALHFKKLNQ